MKDFCTKFQHSIIFVIEILMYAACFATFFLLFSIDNPEILDLSRTAAVTMSTYAIIMLLLTATYGKFDLGMRASRQIFFSLLISQFLTDLATYFELTIMKTNEANNTTFKVENVGIFFLTFFIQAVILAVFSKYGNIFYFWVNEREKCLIVTGDEADAIRVQTALSDFRRRYQVIGIVSHDDENLENRMLEADTIVLYEIDVELRKRVIDFAYQNLKNVYYNPHIADILEQNSRSVLVDDISFFAYQFHMITFEQRIVKRLMDIFISALALIILSPLLLVSAVCIKKYDGGSVFFKQKRATVHGRVFEIIKFRTMKENVGNFSATTDDDRITPPGRFLRKYRIDELPQLLNILKGDMSLVGPRPEMLENVEDYTREMPEFRYRLRMKAGLTGLAQITGKYNTSSRDKLMLDLMYIENYSLRRDLQLLFQTVTVLFKADDSTQAFAKAGEDSKDA